jgi:TonB family protein
MWKNWEGEMVEHKYRLLSPMGSTDHSVVFLAECRNPEPQKCAVKFLAADIPNSEQVIAAWKGAAQLNHPNLLRILGTGRCRIEDMDLLYVAMEYADENLAEIIPQRPLAVEEAREALNAVVDVLVYLHGKGLTHGHICPANILAVGEFLKVSSDTIEPLAEKREMSRERSTYDAPEIPGSPYTQSADVWSLGVTLVEMLTQQPVVLPFNEGVEPVISPTMREPFLEIAKHALRRKPEVRWTSAQIAERLNPSSIVARAAAAGAAAKATAAGVAGTAPNPVSLPVPAPRAASVAQVASVAPPAPGRVPPAMEPLNVPLSKEPAVPLTKPPRASVPPLHLTAPAPRRAERQTFVLPNYALPVFVIALILVAVIVLPKILRDRTVIESSASTAPARVASKPTSEPAKPPATRDDAAAPTVNPAAQPAPREETKSFAPPPGKAAETIASAPAVIRTKESAPVAKARNSSDAQGRGEVLDEELPQIPAKALGTISGTVRVVVKTHVDAAGQVAGAQLQEPGPSRYFADKSVQAAQQWLFTSPEVNGRSVESDWVIRFEYTRDGVKAFPQQVVR